MEIIKLNNENGELTTTSLEIARATGKEHKFVLQDIREEFSIEAGKKKLPTSIKEIFYKDAQGKERPMYVLDEYDTMQLMSRYSKEVRTAVKVEFKRMKEHIKAQQESKQELSTLDVLKLATAEIEKLESRNMQLTSNLLAYEKYGTSVLVREFVKIVYSEDKIEIGEREFWKLLHDQKYIDKNKLPYAQYKKYFEIRSVIKNGKVRKTTKISPKGILYFTNKLIKMTNE